MGFFDKVRASFARFMSGRYGADQLSMALVIAALVISIVGSFTGARMMTMVISDALLIGAFFRMFSKDRYRRAHENEVYLSKTEAEKRQEIPLFHLPEVQTASARAARRGQRDRHLQKLRHQIRQKGVTYEGGRQTCCPPFGVHREAGYEALYTKKRAAADGGDHPAGGGLRVRPQP